MLNVPNFQSVAVLIDADNIQLNLLNQVLEFAHSSGIIKICRAYGDWQKPPLSSFYNTVQVLPIDTIQVNRIAKDTTDKQLMIEAAALLGDGQIDFFIIVSGDGDFRQLCEYIKSKNRMVIGIGNECQSSTYLQEACHSFFYIEKLSEVLLKLKESRLREFEALLCRVLATLPGYPEYGIQLSQLGNTMRLFEPRFESRFGDRKLSEWLADCDEQITICDSKMSISHSGLYERAILLIKAYQQTCISNGRSHIGQMGQLLRQIDSRFTLLFAGKRLSEWLEMYPYIFSRQGNYVQLV